VLHEPVRRGRRQHDDRAIGVAPRGLPDEPEGLLGLRRARDDHDVARVLAQCGPALLEPRQDGRHLDAVRLREHVADAALVDAGVERDQRGDGCGHQKPP
jgi:hypothetical protein